MSSPFWIPTDTPGRLAILARPRGGDWLPDDIAQWKRAGIQTVVSMLTAAEEAELDLAKEAFECACRGLLFAAIPVDDRWFPTDSEAADLVAYIASHLADGRSVGIHCRQGIGRSGLAAVAVLRALGAPTADAIRRVSAARGRPVPETPEQLEWISRFNVPALATAGSA